MCEEIVGHGLLTATGGEGNKDSTVQGGGGAGGRISIQSRNINKLNITLQAYGGVFSQYCAESKNCNSQLMLFLCTFNLKFHQRFK